MSQNNDETPEMPGGRNRDATSTDSGTPAVEDGFLIDVTEMADDMGLEWPAAMTVAARAACAAWSYADNRRDSSHYRSFRLSDVLSVAAAAVCSTGVAKPNLLINLQRLPSDEYDTNNQKLALKLTFEVDDNDEPAIIIMLPEQD